MLTSPLRSDSPPRGLQFHSAASVVGGESGPQLVIRIFTELPSNLRSELFEPLPLQVLEQKGDYLRVASHRLAPHPTSMPGATRMRAYEFATCVGVTPVSCAVGDPRSHAISRVVHDRTVKQTGWSGVDLARRFHSDLVRPILAERFPHLPYAAGRVGSGSDVLGFDDDTSQDHDWGLRLNLFVPVDAVNEVDRELERQLPETYEGLPTRFAFTGQTERRHHVDVTSVSEFLDARLGFDPRTDPSVADWLSLTGQAALEVTAGPVFIDTDGALIAARHALAWYPDDVWR